MCGLRHYHLDDDTPMYTRELGSYPPDFAVLRDLPLHTLWGAARDSYYPNMARWLRYERADVRSAALERLTTAVLWSEFGSSPSETALADRARKRLAWLLDEVNSAHEHYHDIIPTFLQGLRHQLTGEPFGTLLIAWLDALAGKLPERVDAGLIQGTRLLVEDHWRDRSAHLTEWLALLDHPSDYLRGCAAYSLGNFSDEETIPDRAALFDIIGAKERERPGIAGPFWTPQYSGGSDLDQEQTEKTTAWMLDLLEQRKGTPPPLPDMPFNDIAFYLHEMCSHSPQHMWRMLHGGHTALALLTATEMNERVDGVQSVLEALARHSDHEIAIRARNHLSAHYANK